LFSLVLVRQSVVTVALSQRALIVMRALPWAWASLLAGECVAAGRWWNVTNYPIAQSPPETTDQVFNFTGAFQYIDPLIGTAAGGMGQFFRV
jgi:hypothetical protein